MFCPLCAGPRFVSCVGRPSARRAEPDTLLHSVSLAGEYQLLSGRPRVRVSRPVAIGPRNDRCLWSKRSFPGMVQAMHPLEISDLEAQVPLGCPERLVPEELGDVRHVDVVGQKVGR